MATRPTLHQAVQKTKSSASSYNENNNKLMGYIEDIATEQNTAINSIQASVNNLSANYTYITTENGSINDLELDEQDRYNDPLTGSLIQVYRYDQKDAEENDILYLQAGYGNNNIRPYTMCNKWWIKKTYKNYTGQELVEIKAGGYLHLNIGYTNSAQTFYILLPNIIDWVNFTTNVMVSEPYIEGTYSVISSPTATINFASNFMNAGYGTTPLLWFNIPARSGSSNYNRNCIVNWEVTQNKLEPEE